MADNSVKHMFSKYFNDTVVVYRCKSRPGFVIKFNRYRGNEYRCCRCRELGKHRSISIVNDTVISSKDAEIDHHPDCEPVAESVVEAQILDRNET